jgi:hypothetical protein
MCVSVNSAWTEFLFYCMQHVCWLLEVRLQRIASVQFCFLLAVTLLLRVSACRTNHFKRGHSTGTSVESNCSGKAHRIQSAESTRSGSASNTASVGGGAGATPTPDKAGTCVFCFLLFSERRCRSLLYFPV